MSKVQKSKKFEKCEKCGEVYFYRRHKCEIKGKIANKWLVRGEVKVSSVCDSFGSA